jgi:hypothetical protein
MLLVFLTLGLLLEFLHAFKVRFYLDVSSETLRWMWTLAHAHGTLLGLIHIAFGATEWHFTGIDSKSTANTGPNLLFAGRCLTAASLLLPTGFFLGGLFAESGDPGLGVILVPVGGVLLLIGVLTTTLAIRRRG